MKQLIVTLALIAATSPSWAAVQTVTLSVPKMSCAACPITVKKALSRVDGVRNVEASLENKQAIVTFDDAKTNVQALTKATEDAGYPSSIKR